MLQLNLLLNDIEFPVSDEPSYVSYYNILYENVHIGRLKTLGNSFYKPVIGEVARLRGSALPDSILDQLQVQLGCPLEKVDSIELPTEATPLPTGLKLATVALVFFVCIAIYFC